MSFYAETMRLCDDMRSDATTCESDANAFNSVPKISQHLSLHLLNTNCFVAQVSDGKNMQLPQFASSVK